MGKTLRIGTRGSPLALWQAEHIKALLERHHSGLRCTLTRIVTEGDKILEVSLARFGGKGLFVKAIEDALLRKEVDLAVHSMKDLPSDLPPGLTLGAIPPREDPRDALVCREMGLGLADLPPGACIGTSSLRRASQLRFYRNDLVTAPARGNVETRLRKLEEGRFDAIVLALAGLNRLELTHRVSQVLEPEICLPAIGQGALAIEIREDDEALFGILRPLHDPATATTVTAERAFLATMEGGCHVPVACHGELSGGSLSLDGLVARLDGSVCIRRRCQGAPEDAASLGRGLAEQIRRAGGQEILDEIARTELE
jgi:hydroxymethylbilane synthase